MDNKISKETIKIVLSSLSMTVLSIQHLIGGIFATNLKISYIPLAITYLTIFISSLDNENYKEIKKVSLVGVLLIVLTGIIILTLSNYEVKINRNIDNCYNKVMFIIIGLISLLLSILYNKRIISEADNQEV